MGIENFRRINKLRPEGGSEFSKRKLELEEKVFALSTEVSEKFLSVQVKLFGKDFGKSLNHKTTNPIEKEAINLYFGLLNLYSWIGSLIKQEGYQESVGRDGVYRSVLTVEEEYDPSERTRGNDIPTEDTLIRKIDSVTTMEELGLLNAELETFQNYFEEENKKYAEIRDFIEH